MRLDLFLALRFLLEGRVHTALLVTGATVGVTVLFFITALITAVEKTMISQTLDVAPHISLRLPDEALNPPQNGSGITVDQLHLPPQRLKGLEGWRPILKQAEEVNVLATSVLAAGPGTARKGLATKPVRVLGAVEGDFSSVVAIRSRMTTGRFSFGSEDAIVGSQLAKDLGLSLGQKFLLQGLGGGSKSFRVGGIFEMGNRGVDESWVIVSLRNGQSLLNLRGGVSRIDLRLRDVWSADTLSQVLEAKTGLRAESWMTENSQLMVAIRSQRGATLMIRGFMMLAVAIGIASVLVVSILQKSKQIGILRAMGVSRRVVQRVFLFQGAAIGLLGGFFGCGLGTALALASEKSATTPNGTPMYPIDLTPSLYVLSIGLAVGAALMAAAWPSRRAAALEPAKAIRYE